MAHPKYSVGVDIGSHSIKVAKLNYTGKRRGIAFDVQPLQGEDANAGKILIDILRKIEAPTSLVNISLEGSGVIYKFLRFPFMQRSDLIGALKLEWDKFISFKLEEVMWDYEVIDIANSPGKGKQYLLLLTAALKDAVDKKMKILKEVNLSPRIISADGICVLKTFQFLYPRQTRPIVALLNIGERFSNLVVLADGVCRFMRDILFGGLDIRKMLTQSINIDDISAENIKCSLDKQDEKMKDFVNLSVRNLLDELIFSFEYLKRDLEKEVNLVYISGGSSYLYKIKEMLKEALNIEVKILDYNQLLQPVKGVSEDILKKSFPQLAVAAGLALYG